MSTLTVTNPTFSNPANKAEVEQNFSDIESWAAGGIGNDNIAANAAISLTKLEASKEHLHIQFSTDLTSAPGYPIELNPLAGLSTDASWTVDRVEWAVDDFGAGTAAFIVRYGFFSAPNTFDISGDGGNIIAATVIGSVHFGNAAITKTTLPLSAQQRTLAIETTTADATAGTLYVTVRLSRDISS